MNQLKTHNRFTISLTMFSCVYKCFQAEENPAEAGTLAQ